MINKKEKKNKGFTLIEAMVAVFILTISIVSLMNVVVSSLFAARYAKDEITVNYLLQEAVDYVRNDRDTVFLQVDDPSEGWKIFSKKYEICSDAGKCYLDVIDGAGPKECLSSECTILYYNESPEKNEAFYTHDKTKQGVAQSKFKREIEVGSVSSDEISVKVTVRWTSGTMSKERTLETSLLRWQY